MRSVRRESGAPALYVPDLNNIPVSHEREGAHELFMGVYHSHSIQIARLIERAYASPPRRFYLSPSPILEPRSMYAHIYPSLVLLSEYARPYSRQ